MKELEETISNGTKANQMKGVKDQVYHSLVLRDQDFEYLLNLNENEVINTPENKILAQLDEARTFSHPYEPGDTTDKMKVVPLILHEMLHIPEQENILHFEFIVIKPVGFGSAMGKSTSSPSSQGGGTSNKGHVVNAGLLYILESGMMKILSTTGALLVEKNIAFDINPSGRELKD